MYIKLKEKVSPEKMNEVLKKKGIEYAFCTNQMLEDWLNDINTNPKAESKYLKPADRNLTMEELKQRMGRWAEIGLYETDLHFGRTPDDQMQLLAEFISENKEEIEYITESDLLIERGNITNKDYIEVLKELQQPEKKPELLPEDQQGPKEKINGGLMLCKSFSIDPFWVLFGKVDEPKFMKEKKYVDDLDNKLYKDDNGYAFMLLPLYDFSKDFPEKVYNSAYAIGLRENINYFMARIYGFEISNIEDAASQFNEWYTKEELIERLIDTVRATNIYSLNETRIELKNDKIICPYTGKMPKNLLLLLNTLKIAVEKLFGELQYVIRTDNKEYEFKFKNKTITTNNSQYDYTKDNGSAHINSKLEHITY